MLTTSNHQKVLSTPRFVVEMLKLLVLLARILQLLSHWDGAMCLSRTRSTFAREKCFSGGGADTPNLCFNPLKRIPPGPVG